ncbi:MAG: AbiEi antitoxin N-terminal domain-containing protein [Chlorobi bacterium]|nr:AbiEi antitoxin N-terminal domain-containing protein [Chlorobiota bacterium]
MTTNRASKILWLLAGLRSGTVVLAVLLAAHGIPHELLKHYRESEWLKPVGLWVSKRSGEELKGVVCCIVSGCYDIRP